jgi:hypothetical protein
MRRAARRPPRFPDDEKTYFVITLKIGKWLAAPMKKSIGTESQALVREARNARRAQSA